MAKEAAAPRKRVGDYNPDVETGEVLDGIEDKEVTIASVAFDPRTGKKGPYILAIITLDDGSVFHTGGAVVVERLGAIPPEDFPVLATFSMVKSASNPGQSYWTVN
jgi:hypothetical protein